VLECYIQKDRTTGESRGFGFLSFETPDVVDKILLKPSQKIGDKGVVDIKVARPKEAPRGTAVWSPPFGGFSTRPGGWGGPGWGGPPFGGAGWGGPDPYGRGLGAGLGSAGLGMAGSGFDRRSAAGFGFTGGALDRRGAGFGGGAGASVRSDFSPQYQTQGFEQQGYGYGLGASAGATPASAVGASAFGDSGALGLGSGYNQWGAQQSQLDEAKRAGFETSYGAQGAFPSRRAGPAQRTFPYRR